MTAGDAAELGAAADGLGEVVWAIEAVDYNLLLEDDLQELLAIRDDVEALCQRYRHDQHAAEHREGDR